MFARVTAWFHAVGAARKHVVNWPELVLKAVSSSYVCSGLGVVGRYLAMGKHF